MTARATIWTESGATFTLDATVTETHTRALKATSNPVESGAVIADHAILQPTTLTLTGVMVDVLPAIPPVKKNGSALREVIEHPDFINDISIPGTLKSITDQTVAFVNRSIDLIATSVSSLFDGVSNEQRALAPWLPTLFPADVADLSDGNLRIAQAYDLLFTIQKSGLPVSVVTSTAFYDCMVITSVKVNTDASKGNYATFSLDFQEIFIADTQNTGATNSQDSQLIGNCSGRTAAQTATGRNAGEVTPTAAKPSEVANMGEVL